jgi:DNA-binding HxlR family transcriptional regulator
VEYALTPLGRSLLGPLRALEEWAVTNLPAVASHQQGYAAAAAD